MTAADENTQQNGHTMTVTWSAGGWHPDYRPTCHEPAEAICRAQWDCQCEEWADQGVDERGPWHQLHEDYIGTMTDPSTRHYGKPGGECGHLLHITETDMADELGSGAVTFPIDLDWDGDGMTWKVAQR